MSNNARVVDEQHTEGQVVLFLGAGASAFAGYHTFETFPDLLLSDDIRRDEGLDPLPPRVCSFLHEVNDTLRVEHQPRTHDKFLWRLNEYAMLWRDLRTDGVLQARFLKDTEQWGEFAQFDATTQDAISETDVTTVHHYGENRVRRATSSIGAFQRVYEFYIELAKRNHKDRPYLPIFTTNYDMLIEDLHAVFCLGSRPQVPLVTGLGACDEGTPWSRDEFTRHKCHGIHLHRLHGCACWYYHGLGDEKTYFHRNHRPEARLADLCAMYPGREIFRGRDPHGFGFRQLNAALHQCRVLVFVGFSFRDDDVMHLLLAVANERRQSPFRYLIVDPWLRDFDVIVNLRRASERSAFPVRVPSRSEVRAVNLSFGRDDFDTEILSAVDKLL